LNFKEITEPALEQFHPVRFSFIGAQRLLKRLRPITIRHANKFLYNNTHLGKIVEETLARGFALKNYRKGLA